VALGPVLYLLLNLRFGRVVSAAASAACLLLPPVREFARGPGTDSWGLTLLVVGLLSAMLLRERGLRWLPVWIAVVLALSFTRDATVVLVLATGWLAFRKRDRRSVLVAAESERWELRVAEITEIVEKVAARRQDQRERGLTGATTT
jgi:hypothetical protein